MSNSLLSLLKNPRRLKVKLENPDAEDEEKTYFRLGSALDCLLTDKSSWNDNFVVIDATRPTTNLAKFIDKLPCGLTKDSDIELFREAYDKSEYKINIEKIVDKLFNSEENIKYYESICIEERDKYILSKEEFDIVNRARDLVMANPFTQKYFISMEEHIELLHQHPVYFEYRGFECKALLDGIRIDHNAKTIQPFDLKTTGSGVHNFKKSFREFGYYRQASMYKMAIEHDSYIKELIDKGYKILNFIFIVVDNKITSTMAAIMYETSENDIKVGLDGGYYEYKYYPGVNTLLEDLRFHLSTEYWDLPREVYLNNGVIKLDAFKEHEQE